MRFLVTGGSGFIGERVVKNLVQQGIPVVSADWNIDTKVVVARGTAAIFSGSSCAVTQNERNKEVVCSANGLDTFVYPLR
jgi:nucleoside-diphosphate-sugar epimerase